ncbi:MAG: metallophosphoesterase, partial [Pseudomonadota bacterium]
NAGQATVAYPSGTEFEIAAYLENEPYMELGNLIRKVGLYDRALSQAEIAARFEDHRELVQKAVHFRGVFHFTTAAPHVALPTTSSIQLSWEADRRHETLIEWGTTPALGNATRLPLSSGRMTKTQLTDLKANTAYYYRVVLTDSEGEELNSGLLSFRTAVEPGDPVIFAAISDTEARPHVNAHLAELIWRETPHFLINAGDLTDGGRHDQRVEWTHEYFAAMGHLMAQLPVLPVMGNGESDYIWFDRYHADRGPARSYYNFRYGDVEIFVLDSNLTAREDQPSFREDQRAWLDAALRQSDAKWKIATHHHPVLSERYPELVSDFVDLYEAHKVDLVLVGHHHNYLRSWPLRGDMPVAEDGVIYIQLGGGGGNLSDRPRQPDLRWAKTYQGYGYSIISVFGDQLDYRMHDDHGALRDTLTITK